MLIQRIHSVQILMGLLMTATLMACASPIDGDEHDQHHAGQSANAASPGSAGATGAASGMTGRGMMQSDGGCGMMGCGTASTSGSGQHMDKDAMCAMYRSMQNAATEQERQAMMDRQMPGMSPEMRQQHMEMMRQQCK